MIQQNPNIPTHPGPSPSPHLSLKTFSVLGFAAFLVLQGLDLHSSYLLSHGVLIGSVHAVDSRLITTAQELAREVNPVLSGARSPTAFLLRMVAYKVLVIAIWSYTFFTQITLNTYRSTNKHTNTDVKVEKSLHYFFYLSICLNLIYFVVVFNNYTLLSKAIT
jgi:hypothetical protein